MVKSKTEEKSDDIEIVSIGKLYAGQWDKKYWSSSRGKDRYPYPVGYTSVRVQNGITYKMEILEGLKGPLFTISSTEGNSCSGDTPDIAWERFQKKSCSQIKLRRGKRFSCKIDGVELYGFKNPFVQRLLRELVANDSGIEHGSVTLTVSSIAPNPVKKFQIGESIPDPVPCLVQNKVTRKRGRTSDRVISTKRLAETPKQHKHGELAKEVSALNSKQMGKSHGIVSKPSVASTMPTAERGMQLDPTDMSDHPEGRRSVSDKTDGDCKVEHGMLVDANLFVPDTLDHAGENLCVLSLDKDEQLACNVKDTVANNESKSIILPTDSQPEDKRGITDSCTFSESCDSDSVGHEVTKTMLAFLLPQAIPLLKTFTRKKRKSPKPEAVSVHVCEEKSNVPISSLDDGFISRKLVEQSNISSTGHDPLISTSGYTQSVVLDSLDNDDPVDPNTSKCLKGSNGLDPRLLTVDTSRDAKSVLCVSGTKKHEISLHPQAQSSSVEKSPKARQLVEQSNISSTGHDSLVASGYTQFVVPDSLDIDNPVNPVPNSTKKGDKGYDGIDTCTQLTNREAKPVLCPSETKKREINLHSQARSSSSEKPPKARQLIEQSNISSTGHDSLVSTSGCTQYVVPDSLDIDDPANPVPNTSKRDNGSGGLDTCMQLTNRDAKAVLCPSETKKCEINLQSQARSSLSEKPPKARQLIEQSNNSSTGHDSLFSTSGYTQSVVPDSLDIDDPVNSVPYTPNGDKGSEGLDTTQSVVPESLDIYDSVPNTSKGDKGFDDGLDTCTQLTNRDAKEVLCPNETKKREINLQSRAWSSSREKPPKALVRKLVEQSNMSSTCHDSLVSTSGCTQSVVPDSLDNDDLVDSVSNISERYKDPNDLDIRAQLAIGTNVDAKILHCLSETKRHEINFQSQARSVNPPKGPIPDPGAEIIAYSKRRQKKCPSIHKPPSIPVSIAKPSPSLKSINYKSPTTSKSLEARLTEKRPNVADRDDHCVSTSNLQDPSPVNYNHMSVNGEMKNRSRLNIQTLNSNPHGLLDLFAGYVLPMPISNVQLVVKEDDVYVCVKCCSVEHKKSTIFVYKAQKRGENIGCPSLIGYLPLGLESSKDTLGGDSAEDNSIFQFVPDTQYLVLRNNNKIPFCREGKLHCLCSACTSDCLKKNAVKILQINSGYASLVTRLETAQDVRCFLVCEPSFLLAADEGGKLKLWTMHSSWSAQMEHCYLPTHDSMFPCLVELKGVPKSIALVIGHNGLGEFGLWDIDKRTLVSRFSLPGMSVSRCIPTCPLKWQRSGDHRREKLISEIMDATKISFAERYENHNFSVEDKDSAIWLLISTVSDPDSQCYQSSEQQQESQVEYWRLALLVNNSMIVGSALDSGAACVTSAGRGIIGTCDGLVYIWDLSTGKKLGNLHSFKGSDSSVSCITSDTSNSGAVAIASGTQLLVYIPS